MRMKSSWSRLTIRLLPIERRADVRIETRKDNTPLKAIGILPHLPRMIENFFQNGVGELVDVGKGGVRVLCTVGIENMQLDVNIDR